MQDKKIVSLNRAWNCWDIFQKTFTEAKYQTYAEQVSIVVLS